MMRILLFPIIKKNITIFIAVSIVASLGIAVLSGMSGFNHSMEEALYNYIDEYNYPDAIIETELVSKEQTDIIKDINGVIDVNGRTYGKATLKTIDGQIFAIKGYSYGKKDFSKFHFWSGESDSNESQTIRVEYNFAKDNNLKIGDLVKIQINDDNFVWTQISSIVSMPETLGYVESETWGSNPELGIIYFSEEFLKGTENENLCNQFLLKIDDNENREAVLKNVCDKLQDEGVKIKDKYTFENSNVKNKIEMNVEPIYVVCVVVPIAFFLIILLVIYLSMTIIIKQSRQEIGILRSLGFSSSGIQQLYCGFAFFVAISGIVLGIPIGYLIMIVCGHYYRGYYPIPKLPCRFDALSIVLSVVLTLIICLVAAFLSSKAIGKIRPADTMRGKSYESLSNYFIVRTIFRNSQPLIKFTLTTMLRNKKRFWFTIICSAAIIMMIFSTFSFEVSKNNILDQTFNKRFNYDCMIVMNSATDEINIKALQNEGYITDVEKIKCINTVIKFKGAEFEGTVHAVNCNSKLINVPGTKSIPEKGILLEKYAAKQLGAEVGDVVTVGNEKIRVKAISEQNAARISYISLNQGETIDEDAMEIAVINTEDRNNLKKKLSDSEHFLYTIYKDDVIKESQQSLENFGFAERILIGFVTIVGFIIVMITTKTNLMERKREICVLRSQGFSVREISISWMLQLFFTIGIASAIGLPLGNCFARYALNTIETKAYSFIFVSNWKEYAMTVILVTVYSLFGHILAMIRVKRWNIGENTKSND